MKKSFTIKAIWLSVMFLGLFNLAHAQIHNTLTITSPASLVGDYPVQLALFGEQPTGSETGPAVFADNSITVMPCADEAMTNVSGKYAMVDRGVCQYGDKALAAQNAGALGIIVCNNDTTNPDQLIAMPAGDVGDMVFIPSYFMSYNDCQIIRMEAMSADGLGLEFNYQCIPPNYPDNVLWGRNSGEGDFSGGLNGWTVNNSENSCDSTWWWSPTGTASGAFTGFSIDSGTDCNGAMVFVSDFLDNGGDPSMIGSGAGGCVAPTGPGYLESPMIDLTAINIPAGQAMFLEFDHAYRHFFSTYSVEFSANGLTWGGGCNPAPLATTNGPNVNETVKIPVPSSFATAQNLSFRFRHEGNYYYWIVDDVRLTYYPSGPDVFLSNTFYAVPPQYKTPNSQGIEMPFTIDLVNNGDQLADPVGLEVEIFDPSGTEVFRNSFTDDTLALDNCDTESSQNNLFPFAYNDNSLTNGTYTGNYLINVTDDTDQSNNTVPFWFTVTDDIFSSTPSQEDVNVINADADDTNDLLNLEAMTDGSIFGIDGTSPAPFYTSGNAYHVTNATDADGDPLSIEHITFGIFEAGASGFVDVRLFKASDNNTDGSIQPDERVLVGSNSIVADTVSDLSLITIPVWRADATGQFNGEYVELEDNTTYLLSFITRPLVANTQINLLSYPGSTVAFGLKNFDVNATNFAYSGIYGLSRIAGTFFEPLIDGTANDFDATTIDSYGINQLWTEVKLEKLRVLSTNELNKDIQVGIFPNPASEYIAINLDLEKTSPVNLEIFDIKGQLVLVKNVDNVLKEEIRMNVSSLTSGSYTLKIITEDGFIAKNVVIK